MLIPESEKSVTCMSERLESLNQKNLFDTLSPALRQGFAEQGILEPTPVQIKSFYPIMQGQDVLGQSMTGSGKTLAFCLPLSLRLTEQVDLKPTPEPKVLILTPTRELALQINTVFSSLLRPLQIRCLDIIGGSSYQRQVSQLKRGVPVVVGTPGRIADLIQRGDLQTSSIESFVLDEVDQMLDFGFEEDLTKIRKTLPKSVQTIFFSATLTRPIESLARTILNNPISVKVSENGPRLIEHGYCFVRSGKKLPCLINLLLHQDPDQAIIFCETRKDCGDVANSLVSRGMNAAQINSDLGQKERQQTMDRFRLGKVRFLIATNVAARGIDIQDLPLVVNMNVPRETDSYTHRSGRTGRAGSTGHAITLVNPSETRAFTQLMRSLKIKPVAHELPGLEQMYEALMQKEIRSLAQTSTQQKPHLIAAAKKVVDQIPEESAKTLLEALIATKLNELNIFDSQDILCDRPLDWSPQRAQRSSYRGGGGGGGRRPRPSPRSYRRRD